MRKILTVLLICSALFARSDKPSDIPPASEIYINLEPVKCNDTCLLELIREGLLHSFLARYEGSSNQEILQAFNAQISSCRRVFVVSREIYRWR